MSVGASFGNLKNDNALVLTAPVSDGKKVSNIAFTWKGDIASESSRILKKSDEFIKTYDSSINIDSEMKGVNGIQLADALLRNPSMIDLGEGVDLGLGLKGVNSFGTMLSDNQNYLGSHPATILFPAVIISLLMISFNLFGNGLRDALNPSLKGGE